MKTLIFALLLSNFAFAIESREILTCDTETNGRFSLINDDIQGYVLNLEDENYNGTYNEEDPLMQKVRIFKREKYYKIKYRSSTPLMGKERIVVKIDRGTLSGKFTYKARCSFIFSPFCNSGKKVTVRKELLNCKFH